MCTSVGGQFNGGVCTESSGNFLPNGQLYSLFTGQPVPVPNNTLPGIDPTSQNILPFFPLPNSGLNTFIYYAKPRARPTTSSAFASITICRSTDTLNFRYMFSGGPTTDPLSPSGANVPGFPIGADDRAQNFVAQETHVFSPTVIAVARISYLRNKFLFGEHVNHESLDRSRLPISAQSRRRCRAAIHSGCRIRLGRRSHYRPSQHVPEHLRLLWFSELDSRKARIEVRRRIPPRQHQRVAGNRHQRLLCLRAVPVHRWLRQLSRRRPVFFLQGVGDFSARHSRTSHQRLRRRTPTSSPRA